MPNLDYDQLLKLTLLLTDDVAEVERMFRLMVFNVYAGNRDDHAKNLMFIADKGGAWMLSPSVVSRILQSVQEVFGKRLR